MKSGGISNTENYDFDTSHVVLAQCVANTQLDMDFSVKPLKCCDTSWYNAL